MSALVDSLMYVWLIPVRAANEFVHYVRRDVGRGIWGRSLCGASGPLDRYGRSKFRRVQTPGGKVCNACHVAACSHATRVDYS